MKNFVVLLFVAALVVVPLTAFGSDFSNVKCLSPKETAEELLTIEASGRQLGESTCMKQENFPRYKVSTHVDQGDGSAERSEPLVLSGKQPYEVKSTTKDKDDRYTVKFDYKLSNGKRVSDSLVFVLYQSGELKSAFGCAAVVAAPKTVAIHVACLPKK